MKLKREFYLQDTTEVAKQLIGKTLVHRVRGTLIKGRIVETEAYLGFVDKAAHSYGGRRTKRTETMFGSGGYSYVYLIYGMYYCFNVVTKEEGIPEAVLIRAVEPLEESLDDMSLLRHGKVWSELSKMQRKNLTNGPGKLAISFGIDRSTNGLDLTGDEIYIEEGQMEGEIVRSKRIGIDYAEEAKDWLLRFHLKDNPNVSLVGKK